MKKIILYAMTTLFLLTSMVVKGQATEILSTEKETNGTGIVIDVQNAANSENGGIGLASKGLSASKVNGSNGTRMRYLYALEATIHITPEGVASVYAEAISDCDDLDNLLVVAELQQLRNGEWYTLRTYRCFTGDYVAIVNQTCNVDRGYYYRVVNTSTAYVGTDSETKVLESPSWNFYVPGT